MSENKIPYHNKPDELSVDEWQSGLRKQYAREQNFKFTNIGDHLVYSDFEVYNPKSDKTYKVSIRDGIESFNFCSCPDFKVNALGTCKHIEFLLYYFSKYKKYQKHLANPCNPDHNSLSIFYGIERKIRLHKADNIEPFENEKEYFDAYGYLKTEMLDKLNDFIQTAMKVDPGFIVYPDVTEYMKNHRKRLQDKSIAKELFAQGNNAEFFNGLIKAQLYPYQKEGVQRIIKEGRILLADEMGLGKTIQAIAATEIFANHYGVNSVLIICPTSLKYQWKREIEKFTSRKAVVVEGYIHKRKDLYQSQVFYKIISYGVCRNDLEHIQAFHPDLVIIDEAQRIKNWKTQTAQSVKKIQTEYAIVLTGTPLENKIDELHSIIEYIDRYKLGPLFRFLHNHQLLDEYGKLKGYKNLREINSTLSDILLRRTKKEIKDQLPGRIDKNFFIDLTKEQATDHQSYYDEVCKLVNLWIRQGMLSESDREKLLMLLNCMRMVCDSTYILDQNTNHGNKIAELKELLSELLLNDENKIVIFSQWKRMFELVIKELENLDIKYVYLNGDISAKQRKEIIDVFQENDEIKIFLSTDAGGVGVNLQSANILINLDLPWNPAVLEQRIGRIYRLGQKKHVNIFNFIARLSIEHRILHLLDFKKSVFKGVIEEEGEDSVMLESFLESIKAMTEVNLEETPDEEDIKEEKHQTRYVDNLADENNKRVLEEYKSDISGTNPETKHKNPFGEKRQASKNRLGIFAAIGEKINKFFRRFKK